MTEWSPDEFTIPTPRQLLSEFMTGLPRMALLWIVEQKLPDWKDQQFRRATVIAAARNELVRRYPCQDCGATKGQECKPDYGCKDSTRSPHPRHPATQVS